MSADSGDNHPYKPDSREPDEAQRRHYWAVAIGLQEVDGLQVSPYLRSLGFSVGNDPFASQARYYRDALVRANYRNPQAKVAPDFRFLERFYDDLVNDAGHPLRREDLVCPALFDDPSLMQNWELAQDGAELLAIDPLA